MPDSFSTFTQPIDFSYIWALALPLAGGALVDLTLSFPQEARFAIGRPYLRWGGYVIALILAGYSYVTMSNLEQPRAYFSAWYASYFFDAFAILLHLGVTIHRGFLLAVACRQEPGTGRY